MNCHRLTLDPTGKPAGDAATLSQAKMVGSWAPRAYQQSWDGKTLIAYTFDGLRVTRGSDVRDYKIGLLHKNLWWSPDNKHFLIWLPSGIAVCNVDELGPANSPPKFKVIYRADKGRYPMGIGWAPTASHIYVSEHYDGPKGTQTSIKKVSIDGGSPIEILNHPSELLFYMLPDSWYEDGSGPKVKKFPIVFGAKDGLYVMDGDGQGQLKVAEFAPENVTDVIWDPSGKEQFLVSFRQPLASPVTKKTYKGLYLVHADKKGAKEDQVLELLTDATDLHTIYFSRKGKYVCWANESDLFLREVGKQEPAKKIVIKDASGSIKGFYWDDTEKKIAVAIANKLFVYDVTTDTSTCVVKADEKAFIAEPHWKGNEIVYSTFTNISQKKKLDDAKKK